MQSPAPVNTKYVGSRYIGTRDTQEYQKRVSSFREAGKGRKISTLVDHFLNISTNRYRAFSVSMIGSLIVDTLLTSVVYQQSRGVGVGMEGGGGFDLGPFISIKRPKILGEPF